MNEVLTDAEALQASLVDPARFAVVYDRHLRAVHRFLRWRIGDDGADDLTAEVFVRAFRGRARYGVQHDTALPWLLGIASNVVGSHRRAERHRLATLVRLTRDAELVENAHELASLSPQLVRALKRLPARDRDTLLLVAWGELTYEETARALSVPIGTVRSRIARARERLTACGVIADPVGSSRVVKPGENHA